MFTRFGGTIEPRVQAQLTRGARLRAILRQAQHAPMSLGLEVALVLAVQAGMLDALSSPQLAAFQAGLSKALDHDLAHILDDLSTKGTFDPAARAEMLDLLAKWVSDVQGDHG